MRYFNLIIAVLLGALTALADYYEDKYDFYDLDLVPYDFEVDGVYYRYGTEPCWINPEWPDEPTVSVTIGLTEVDKTTFNKTTYSYYTGDVVVPSTVTYEGVTYTVREVNAHAFAYNNDLHSVVLPETVEAIGYGAFAYCPNLTSVKLPNNVWMISRYAFYHSGALVDMPIPDSVKFIGQYAFIGCDKYALRLPEKLECVFDFGANMDLSYPEGLTLPALVKDVYEFPRVRRMKFSDNIPVDPDQPGAYAWIRGRNSTTRLPEIMEELVLPKAFFNVTTHLLCGEKLERIILPEVEAFSVWYIGGIIWKENPGEFVSMSTVPPIIKAQNPSLGDCYDATLVVPAGSENAYRKAPVWREFKTVRGDADIQRYLPGDTNDVPAIEQSATAEEEVRYFDMMGRPVAAPVPGRLYITSDGRKVVTL